MFDLLTDFVIPLTLGVRVAFASIMPRVMMSRILPTRRILPTLTDLVQLSKTISESTKSTGGVALLATQLSSMTGC